MASGFAESEARRVSAGGGVRPGHCWLRPGLKYGGSEVVGEFDREHRATSFAAAQQGVGNPLMQHHSARWCKRRVDSFPIQVVDEPG
jgi:hypothetical protein